MSVNLTNELSINNSETSLDYDLTGDGESKKDSLEFFHENETLDGNSSIYNASTGAEHLEFFYFYQTEQLTFLWVIFIMIVAGNSAVLIALLLSKNRKTRMNFFIMHLALADLAVGIINVLTDIIWRTTVGFYAGNFACKLIKYLQVLVTYSSTYVLVALSVDRYEAIAHPMNFSTSWRKSRLLVGSAWGLAVIFSIPSIFLNSEKEIRGMRQCWIDLEPWQWQVYITLVAVSLFFLPALIIAACYTIIVYTIWTKSRLMGYPKIAKTSSIVADSSAKQPKRADNDVDRKRASSRGIIPRAKIKTVKMTLVIIFVFILCWSPYFVYDLLQVYGHLTTSQTSIAVSSFIQSLAPLNSAANPIIYCLFSTHICKNFRLPCWCFSLLLKPSQDSTMTSRTSDCSTVTENLTSRKSTTRAVTYVTMHHQPTIRPSIQMTPKTREETNAFNSRL